MAERQGISIDYCPQCRGIWLDHGELEKFIEFAERNSSTQSQNSQSNIGHLMPPDHGQKRSDSRDYYDAKLDYERAKEEAKYGPGGKYGPDGKYGGKMGKIRRLMDFLD